LPLLVQWSWADYPGQPAPRLLALEEAEAEIEQNDLAAVLGIKLPDLEPVLHYSRNWPSIIWPQSGAVALGRAQ